MKGGDAPLRGKTRIVNKKSTRSDKGKSNIDHVFKCSLLITTYCTCFKKDF